MNHSLCSIRNKIDTIQRGLLRYDDKKKKITLHVTAKANANNTLTCTIADTIDLKKLAKKKVNLVQKSEDDYLYISGEVSGKDETNEKTLCVNILKACWFVRKSKGSLSWLQEKHVYSILP